MSLSNEEQSLLDELRKDVNDFYHSVLALTLYRFGTTATIVRSENVDALGELLITPIEVQEIVMSSFKDVIAYDTTLAELDLEDGS